MEKSIVKKKDKNENSRGHFIASIIANGIFLFILNKLPDWNLFFINPEAFRSILPVINISIAVHLSGYFMLLFYNPQYLYHLANMVFGAISIRVIWALFSVFPFVFSETVPLVLPKIVKGLLILGIIGTGISIVIHAVKCIVSFAKVKDVLGEE